MFIYVKQIFVPLLIVQAFRLIFDFVSLSELLVDNKHDRPEISVYVCSYEYEEHTEVEPETKDHDRS